VNDREVMPISSDLYRSVFGGVPAPVAVVTTARRGNPHGTTVSAFCSLSLDPPLVLVSLDRGSELLRAIRRTRRFCVNVLAAGQEDLALRFSRKGSDKFDGLPWFEKHGLPVLPGCQSWVTAAVERVTGAGDHMTVSGLVFDAQINEATPLLYHARRFDELAGLRRSDRRRGASRASAVGTRGVEFGVSELGAGRPVLLFDPVRERADLVAVAERITLEVVDLMTAHGGALAVAVTEARARQLALPRGAGGVDPDEPATVVARSATGVARPQAALATVAALVAADSSAADLTTPGLVTTLVARNGGLLEYLGRAEAALDAARLSGAAPVAAVCEVQARDGSPLARDGVVEMARELSIPVVDLEELAQTRRELEWSLW
jgi:flavin reductase (DIM6/NTAB) family NADH-FMN oxidoreductase RutF/3,4-dihydroxy-2-butanone 4-phosphate synthase